MRTFRWRWLVIVPVLALTLAACSSGSKNSVATLTGADATASATPTLSAADREALALKFAQCMRQNGVPDFPDPTVDQNGNLQLFSGGALPNISDREKIRTAFQACGQYAQGLRSGFSSQDQQQMQDAILAFAQCMRANGYNMPDPTFGPRPTAGSSPTSGQDSGRGPFGGFNQNDPAFQKAFSACRDKLPGIVGGRGGGFGGGPSAQATPGA